MIPAELWQWTDTIEAMKHCIAGVYTNYKTTIVSAPDMELAEGFTAGPRGGKLELSFQPV